MFRIIYFFAVLQSNLYSCNYRATPGAAAEMLAQEFNSILKENISSRGPAQALFEVTAVILKPFITSGTHVLVFSLLLC